MTKKKSATRVLIGKGSYTSGKVTVRKGEAVNDEFFNALSEEKKTLFTDPKTAAKLLKAPVVVKTAEDGGEDELTATE